VPVSMPEHRVLSSCDKVVLHELDRLLAIRAGTSNSYWFTVAQVRTRADIWMHGISRLTVKKCLDRFVAEGIVVRHFSLWCWRGYTLRLSLEVIRLANKIRVDAVHGVVLNYNVETQALYEAAVVACGVCAVCNSVEVVYKRRLAERLSKVPFKPKPRGRQVLETLKRCVSTLAEVYRS